MYEFADVYGQIYVEEVDVQHQNTVFMNLNICFVWFFFKSRGVSDHRTRKVVFIPISSGYFQSLVSSLGP